MSPQENAFLGYDLLTSMISNLYPVDNEVDKTPFKAIIIIVTTNKLVLIMVLKTKSLNFLNTATTSYIN